MDSRVLELGLWVPRPVVRILTLLRDVFNFKSICVEYCIAFMDAVGTIEKIVKPPYGSWNIQLYVIREFEFELKIYTVWSYPKNLTPEPGVLIHLYGVQTKSQTWAISEDL